MRGPDSGGAAGGGSVFRVVQFPPDKDWAAKAAAMGGSVAIDETARSASKGGPVRHAHMHCTCSIDYAIVLSGEIWAVMDIGETRLVAGDVLIQRGNRKQRHQACSLTGAEDRTND